MIAGRRKRELEELRRLIDSYAKLAAAKGYDATRETAEAIDAKLDRLLATPETPAPPTPRAVFPNMPRTSQKGEGWKTLEKILELGITGGMVRRAVELGYDAGRTDAALYAEKRLATWPRADLLAFLSELGP